MAKQSKILDIIQAIVEASTAMAYGPTVSSQIRKLNRKILRTDDDLGDEINAAMKAMHETSELVERLQARIATESGNIAKLNTEVKRLEAAKQMSAEAVRPMLQIFEQESAPQRAKERWIGAAISAAIGLIFLVLGVILADPIKDGWESIVSFWQANGEPSDASASPRSSAG